MTIFARTIFVTCSVGLFCCSPIWAQSVETPLQQQVIDAIERLDSSKFSERNAAERQLQQMGDAAIQPLESVVLTGDLDSSNRALAILKKHFQSDRIAMSRLAGEALQRIADNRSHPKAAAAQKILQPPVISPNRRRSQPRFPQIPQAGGMQNRISISVKTVNGRREIKVDQNGQKWRFADDPNGGIQVERPDGQGGKKAARYNDKKALEQADPEAFKMYERYAKGNGIQMQFGGGMFGQPFQFPGMQVPQIGPPAIRRPEIQRPLGPLRPIQPRQPQPENRKPRLPPADQLIEV